MMKKKSVKPVLTIMCLALTMTITICFANDVVITAAGFYDELPVIDSQMTCPDDDHIHVEDDIDLHVDGLFIASGGEDHCYKGSKVGKLLTSSIIMQSGYSNRSCTHGNVGVMDYCYQYQKVITYNCNQCMYYATFIATSYDGSWICGE